MKLLVTWSQLPKSARRYILYHCMVTPLLFTWYLIPYLMFQSGLEVFEAGFLFTLGALFSSMLTLIVGRFLDRGEPNVLIAVSHIIDGLSYMLYFFAFSMKSSWLILLAISVNKFSGAFYPAYAVYEYVAYPSEIRDVAFLWHNILPFTSQAITYPIIGFIFGVLFPTIEGMLAGLLIVSFLTFLIIPLLFTWLPRVKGDVVKEDKPASRKVFIKLNKSFILAGSAYLFLIFADYIVPPLVLVNVLTEFFGGGLFEVGVYEAIVGVTLAFSSILLLKFRSKRKKLMLTLGYLLVFLADTVMFFSFNIYLTFLSAFLMSIGGAIAFPYQRDILYSTIPEEFKGTYMGVLSAVSKVIGIVSPLIAGFIASIHAQLPYALSALLVVFSILLFIITPYENE